MGCFLYQNVLAVDRKNGCLSCLGNFAVNFVHFIHHQFCTLHRSPKTCAWLTDQFRTCHPSLHESVTKDEASIKIDDTDVKSSSSKKLLGVLIDNKPTFNEHLSKRCKKASNKLHALARISKYMTKDKLRTIINAFFLLSSHIAP